MLGKGAFGEVYLGFEATRGELIAVKIITFSGSLPVVQQQIKSVQEEIDLMRRLDHPNIVAYRGCERSGRELRIFMEFVPGMGFLLDLCQQAV